MDFLLSMSVAGSIHATLGSQPHAFNSEQFHEQCPPEQWIRPRDLIEWCSDQQVNRDDARNHLHADDMHPVPEYQDHSSCENFEGHANCKQMQIEQGPASELESRKLRVGTHHAQTKEGP